VHELTTPTRRVTGATLVTVFGTLLVVVALVQATWIPRLAHDDFDALVRAHGGSMTHSATYPDTFRLMSAQRRMLQNAYVGAAGLLLVGLGGAAMVRGAGLDRLDSTGAQR
jgi:hypothetical protein